MIVEQQRTGRDSFSNRETEPPTDLVDGGEYLYTAEVIAGLIATHYESALRPGRIVSIKLADAQIRPDQRFYLVEFDQASQILAARSITTETAQNWFELMKNHMQHRLVEIAVCEYGQETDPVTRQCVTETAKKWEPEPKPKPKPLLKPLLSEKTSSLILPLGIVGIVLLVMLGGRK